MTWDEWREAGEEIFLANNDPDRWIGNEAEWCILCAEYSVNYADQNYEEPGDDDDEDDDCSHQNTEQDSDGAYRCIDCRKITYDISDNDFAAQNGDNFSSSDFQGW